MKQFNALARLAASALILAASSTSAFAGETNHNETINDALDQSITVQLEHVRKQIALASQIDVLDDIVTQLATIAPENRQNDATRDSDEPLIAKTGEDIHVSWVSVE